jgi:glycosyltransferase involved in cell wall biosynthesis
MNDQITTAATRETPGCSLISPAASDGADAPRRTHAPPTRAVVALLTGGGDRPYAIGMATSLVSQGIALDYIGSDAVDHPDIHQSPLLRFLNLRGDMSTDVSVVLKALRVLIYYGRLIRYSATAKPKVFHILWNNKFEWLDRTLLLLWYRLLGKRIAFTVHNVNAAWRDGNDSFLNRLTLRIQYRLVDHLFVHSVQLKGALQSEYNLPASKISVIPFGINNTVPSTALTSSEARKRLGLTDGQRVLLFFGQIAPYKGLEYLVDAMTILTKTRSDYMLVISGRPKNCAPYWEAIQERIASANLRSNVVEQIGWSPDADTEMYFKAADAVVLPYTYIFQSGILYIAYNFGLPIIASDVGTFREDIIEGQTGFLFNPRDPADLAKRIEAYFDSDLYRQLAVRRNEIRNFGLQKYSWTEVAKITGAVYANLLR